MIDIESLLQMWSSDSKIDEINLDVSSIETASMHAKYLEIYSAGKLKLKRKELQHAELKRDLWLYYNGKMTKDQMDERGWAYDPFDGCTKPMKSDMAMYYECDPAMKTCQMQLEECKVFVDTCKEILDTLRWRSSTIKNIIEYKKFTSGA